MRKVGESINYIKYKELEENQVIFEKAKYVESFKGKYGENYKFVTDDMSQVVLPSAGYLDWLVKTYLTEGMNCKVVYGGLKPIEKGKMAGNTYHHFELFIDEIAPVKVSNNVSLDDLE